jgi:hypothetical protein
MSKQLWPRWITTPAGNTMIVPNHQTMSAFMGEEYDENAELVVKRPEPPTLAEVLAAGYGENVAMRIVAREHAKQQQGVEPYGQKPLSEFIEPEPLILPEPNDSTPPEGFTPAAAAAIAEVQAETEARELESIADAAAAPFDWAAALGEEDPAGIFSGPEPEVDLPEVTPEQPKKKRGKAAKE